MNYRLPFMVLVFALLLIVGAQSVSASSGLLYAQGENGTLFVADTSSNGIITNAYLDGGIWVLANPAGTRVYASADEGDKIYVLRPGTNTIVSTINLNCPEGMAITSDGNTMYAAMWEDDKVAIIDLRTNTIKGYINVGDEPYAVAVSPDDSRVFVTNYNVTGNNAVSIIDTSTNTITAQISTVTSNGSCDVVFSKDGTKAFVLYDLHYTGNARIGVYQVSDGASITSITTDYYNFMGGLEIDPRDNYIWVSNANSISFSAYSTSTYALYKTVQIAQYGDVAMDVRASGNNLYIAHGYNITVYDLNTENFKGNITTTERIWHMDAFNPSDTIVDVSPQLVTFTAKTGYRTLAVTGLNVSVYDNTNTLLYSGVTDSAGVANFVLIPTTTYHVLFNQSPNINTWYNITPSYTGYIVDIPFSQVIGLTSWSDQIYNPPGEEISWKLAVTYNSTTGAGSLTPTYNDTGTVSSVTFSFYQNASFGEADTLLENQTPAGSGSWTYTENLASATGNNYYVIITVVKPDGTFTYVSGLAYTFPGPKVLAGVFPADWYFWLAWGVVLCFYAVGTITKKGLFVVFGAAMGIIMAKWGWYSLVFPDIIAYPAIGFTFIVGVVVLMIERERYT